MAEGLRIIGGMLWLFCPTVPQVVFIADAEFIAAWRAGRRR